MSTSSPHSRSNDQPRRVRRAAVVLALALLAGACSHLDLNAVHTADRSAGCPGPDEGEITGRIRHFVDGQPLAYGLWNRPAMQFVQRGTRMRMPSPLVGSDGRFAWRLPPGDYDVHVIAGGLAPTGQPDRLPSGTVAMVNGLLDPGIAFSVRPGSVTPLGTIEISVESRAQKDVWLSTERVFGRLLGIRALADPESQGAVGSRCG